jgi:hypothetical protein
MTVCGIHHTNASKVTDQIGGGSQYPVRLVLDVSPDSYPFLEDDISTHKKMKTKWTTKKKMKTKWTTHKKMKTKWTTNKKMRTRWTTHKKMKTKWWTPGIGVRRTTEHAGRIHKPVKASLKRAYQ